MKRILESRLPLLFIGIMIALVISGCAAAFESDDGSDAEPTVVPTPTESVASSTPASETEPMQEATEAPAPTSTPEPEPEPTEPPAEEEAEPETATDGDGEQVAANPTPGRPVELRIDRLGVSAPFEYVGVTPQGDMAAPEGWDNVAWYEPGTVPGAQGNSVIAGHYDRPGGGAAVFYELRNLGIGDRITIRTEHNEELIFEVTEIEAVSVAEAPLQKIFGKTDEHNLNLITCEGVWDEGAGMYDQRLIVYTSLVSE